MNVHRDELAHLATKEAAATIATRLDATLPHLATKADLHQLGERMHQMGNRLLYWLTGTLVTCLVLFYGLHTSMMKTQQQELSQLRQLTQSIDERLDRIERREAGQRQLAASK